MPLILDHVSYLYDGDTPHPVRAVDNISLTISENEYIGIIGHTGSGKSTFIQLLNGLLKPSSGTITYNGKNIWDANYNIRNLRFNVGLVFQYPEHQLFEDTVIKDVCFGPKNQGIKASDAEELARNALRMVGLDASYEQRSPFELSGGEKRRVAIAGVLAMQPKFLILDEPMAGLDPKGRDDILSMLSRLHRETGITVLLVSHSMDDVARYADRLIVIDAGRIRFDDTPRKVFAHEDSLKACGLNVPQMTLLAKQLKQLGFDVPLDVMTVKEMHDVLLACLKRREGKKEALHDT